MFFRSSSRFRLLFSFGLLACLLLAGIRTTGVTAIGQERAAPSNHAARLPTEQDPILISADFLHQETSSAAADEQIIILRGRCHVKQGTHQLRARQMVIWKSQEVISGQPIDRIVVYAEEEIEMVPAQPRPNAPLFVELVTAVGVTSEARHPGSLNSLRNEPIYLRAQQHRSGIVQTALNQPRLLPPENAQPLPPPDFDFNSVVPATPVTAQRRIIISRRSFGVGFDVKSYLSEETSPPEQVTVITNGVNIVIEGMPGIEGQEIGPLDISADQVVIWTQANASGNFSPEMFQDADAPLQLYLEGNIEIRQGENILKANRAFYDVREDRASLLDGELRIRVPDTNGDVKLKAERIRQLSCDSYHAENAWISASEFGKPTYRMEAGDLFLENRSESGWIGQGDQQIDPQSGIAVRQQTPWMTSLNNRFRVGETPIFMAPYISGPVNDPHVPLENLTVAQDSIFGGQLKTVWNLSKLLGINTPANLDWNLQANMYTERGFWLGTDASYLGTQPLGEPGSFFGEAEAVWISDYGRDNLGLDRRGLDIPDNQRGRVLHRHRQQLTHSLSFTSEVGFLSDRNFLEQYYEEEWDSGKDNETLMSLDYQEDNLAASIMTRFNVNDFEYNTQWLPKADVTLLGEPLLWDRLVYSTRTSAGYGQIKPAAAPDNPNDLFVPLDYYPAASGAVFSSRHELSLPFNLGPVKVDPYLMGEAAYWQDDGFNDQSLNRLYGSAGVRASMMLWKVFPEVHSRILGLNGLAHKQVIGFDYYIAESSEDLRNIPQYNEFDENSQERFRTRLITNTYGLNSYAAFPQQYDPRNFAVRSGAARNVSSPYFELVDSQEVLRLNWNHRLQTKVGPPERQRIKDWMTLDLGLSYFPDADEDNFGEDLGLLTANYMWDVGARTKILANGQFDFFEEAPQVWDVGFVTQRGKRGSVYLGYRDITAGPLSSQLVTGSFSYSMSPKWIATFGTAYDIAENEDRGQSLTITGVRSDFLIHLGLSVDSSKGNFGVGFMIEPKLGPLDSSSNKMDSILGTR